VQQRSDQVTLKQTTAMWKGSESSITDNSREVAQSDTFSVMEQQVNKVICFKDDKTSKETYETMHISMVVNPNDVAVYLKFK
jgi:hypothetical protein